MRSVTARHGPMQGPRARCPSGLRRGNDPTLIDRARLTTRCRPRTHWIRTARADPSSSDRGTGRDRHRVPPLRLGRYPYRQLPEASLDWIQREFRPELDSAEFERSLNLDLPPLLEVEFDHSLDLPSHARVGDHWFSFHLPRAFLEARNELGFPSAGELHGPSSGGAEEQTDKKKDDQPRARQRLRKQRPQVSEGTHDISGMFLSSQLQRGSLQGHEQERLCRTRCCARPICHAGTEPDWHRE